MKYLLLQLLIIMVISVPGYTRGGSQIPGSGGSGLLLFDRDTVNFGTVQLGQVKSDTLTVSNPGISLVRLLDVTVTQSEFSVNPRSWEFIPGAGKIFAISAVPDSLKLLQGMLVFNYDGTSLTDTVHLNVESVTTPRPGKLVLVNSVSGLKSAIQSAVAGDTIEVSDGTYNTNGSLTMSARGTCSFPIIVRAQNRGMVNLTGESYFDLRQSAHVRIEGFVFTGTDVTAVKLQACNNIRITRNVFRLHETVSLKWLVVGGIWNNPAAPSRSNRIDHNLFEEKHYPGNCITIDGGGDPVYQVSQFDTIDYNHFRNVGPRQGNDMETIRLGWSEMSMSSAGSVVQFNLFEECDGDPEIISVKSCDNTVRFNTFRRSQGTVCLRHGNRSVIESNFFFGEGKPGTGGVRVYGDDHKIYNNYFEGLTGTTWDAPITLTNGDYDGGGNLSKHWRINRAEIRFNTLVSNEHHIEIGFDNNGSYSKPPRDVVIANNLVAGSANELVKIWNNPSNMTWLGNLMHPTGSASLGITVSSQEILVADPLLVRQDSLWKLSETSPAIDMGGGDFAHVSEDVEGQLRDLHKDTGADEFTQSEITRRPLTAADVGPDAPEILTGLNSDREVIHPQTFRVSPNYPNPFNPVTFFEVSLAKRGRLDIRVYDVLGRQVDEITNAVYGAGIHRFYWDGSRCSSGAYFFQVKTGEHKIIRKMLLLK